MPCILPDDLKKLSDEIKHKGGIRGLRNMTAEQRVQTFAPFVDIPGKTDTAEWLNREFEKKVLQPSQVQAAKEWLKKLEKKGVKGTNKKPLLDRIISRPEIMNPKGARMFAEGVAEQLMGFAITREDAKQMFELSKTISEQKKRLFRLVPNYTNMSMEEVQKLDGEALQARQELAQSMVRFQKLYTENSLKAQQMIHERKNWGGRFWDNLLSIAGNIKSLKASIDFSFLRQLQNTAYVNWNSFQDAMKKGYQAWFESPEGVDTMLGDLLTRPNALNGNYNAFNIEVGIKEEAFPESWVSKQLEKYIPKANLLRRSEESFNLAIQTARANLFDWMLDQTKSEENPNGDLKLLKVENVGKAINTITGRGEAPLLTSKDDKQNRIVNNLLFAPKWLASRIQTLTDLRFVGEIGKLSPKGIRARAAVGNLIMMAIVTNALRYLFDREDDESFYEWLGRVFDPRSSDFGKIKIGRTRFDLTTGTAALITLAARVSTGETRTTTTGKIKKQSWAKTIGNFIRGKSAPAARLVSGTLFPLLTTGKTEDFWGNEQNWKTAGDIANNLGDLLAPISIQTGYETLRDINLNGIDEETFGMVLGWLSDIIGIAATTYDRK
jgi:uncharacterized protein YdbL (DUF1318 family)